MALLPFGGVPPKTNVAGTGITVVNSGSTSTISLSGSGSPFDYFVSSAVTTTSGTIFVNTFTTFTNSPNFTFTPNFTGIYKVYCPLTLTVIAGASVAVARVFLSLGAGTLLQQNDGSIALPINGSGLNAGVFIQSVYSLTKGTLYVFNIQGQDASGAYAGMANNGSAAPFYMFAERIG